MAVKLDIRHLQLLVALDRHGTVTAAARELGLTQPALSHQIREAERRAGVPLFRRVKKRLLFTWQGQELLASARLVIAELERAEGDLARYGQTVNALVRLVTRAYCRFDWLPAYLAALAEAHPDIEVELHGETLSEPYAVLDSGAADLVLAPGRVRRGGLRVVPAFDDELVALVAADDPRARRPYLDAGDFGLDCYVTYSTVLEGGMEHELLFRAGGGMPQRYQRASSSDAMATLVEAGHGVSIVGRWCAGDLARRHRIVPVRLTADGLPIGWSVVLRADLAPEQPAMVMGEHLASWLGAHAAEYDRQDHEMIL